MEIGHRACRFHLHCGYIKELRVGPSLDRLGQLITNLTAGPTTKTSVKTVLCDRFKAVPLIPMQLVMAASQMRAREHLQMHHLPVIMQLQDQPLPQSPNTIPQCCLCTMSGHHLRPCLAPVLFQHAPPVTQNDLQTCASGTPWPAAQIPPCSSLSPSFCTSCSLSLFYPAKFLVDSLDFRQVMYPFVKSFDNSA